MSRKLYHLNKFLYIKFSNRKAPRNETFLEEIADIHSINYNLKSIFSIKNISLIVQLKFSVIILDILYFNIKKKVFESLLFIRKIIRSKIKS